MLRPRLFRLAAGALLLAGLSGCNPYIWGGAAFATVPNATTGRNAFYHLDKAMGPRCEDLGYLNRPVRCANDPDLY